MAGWLVQLFTAPITILRDAPRFSSPRIGLADSGPGTGASGGVQKSIRCEIAEGLHAVLRDPVTAGARRVYPLKQKNRALKGA